MNLSWRHHAMSRARKSVSQESDPDRHLGSELRQGAGREWVEEAAEDEQLTELLRRRRLDVADRLREASSRGDRVRAETAGQTFAGPIGSIGADFARIDRPEDRVDVVLAQAVWTVEPSPSGGSEQSGSNITFMARLREIADGGGQVRVVTSSGTALVGTIEVVARDHIEMAQDSNRVVIPLGMITALVSSTREF